MPVPLRVQWGRASAAVFVVVALLLLLLRWLAPLRGLALLEAAYRSAALAWGGGGGALVALWGREASPAYVTPAGFALGVGCALAAPGPGLFNLAAYVGAAYAGPLGALVGFVAMHTPGLLALHAALPSWVALRSSSHVRLLCRAVNAAAAGLTLAATMLLLRDTSAPPQQAIALLAFAAHASWASAPLRLPPRYHPPATVALGTVLGLPMCLPWLLGQPSGTTGPAAYHAPHGAASGGATTAVSIATHAATSAASPSAGHALPPPPPEPWPPDPSPPPPPVPEPPTGK